MTLAAGIALGSCSGGVDADTLDSGTGGGLGASGATNPGPGSNDGVSGAPTTGGAGQGRAGSATSGGSASGGNGATGAPCTDTPPSNGDTCAHAVEYGWCKEDWLNGACAKSCGTCTGSTSASGGAGNTGGSNGIPTGGSGNTGNVSYGGGGGQPPAIEGGSNGWASRYWDCCKPACGWKGNVPGNSTPVSSCSAEDQSLGGNYDAKNACESGGSAFMCHDFGPWAVSATLAYGFAAVSRGNDYCGKCYQLQFTGKSHSNASDPGSKSLTGKTMIVQAINNGGVGSDQFDLLVPGGGVGDFDACTSQWGTSDLGERYGGFYLACQKQNGFDYAKAKACAAGKCQSVFANKPELLAACNWFGDWFGAPDNPELVYEEVACPEAITSKSRLKR